MGHDTQEKSSNGYRITIVAGVGHVGITVPVDPDMETTIGRQEQCTLTIPSGRVAPVHCKLRYEHGCWRIMGSTDPNKGVRYHLIVNDRRCLDADLNIGDRIEIGGYRILFNSPSALLDDTADEDTLTLDLEPFDDLMDGSQTISKKTPDNMPSITLNVIDGPQTPDTQFTALPGESILIGSSDTALWRLSDRTASRHHCRVETDGHQWIVRDLQSRNGTFVDALRVSTANLVQGSRLAIGRYQIHVTLNS